ncbi:hypothetical protein VE01_00243 [Pseudogymnoascus verrucosus]|uniref:Uncharacterized protein n=1 Tax=Pseudogymnoascus verrucosus TaxID=342668 RepID=A0A2P2SXS9_9PEZI|nr:uncharacterized protein VE01_00243 [Pseudogymnoascus verrucosus]OBU01658.1 hypothetical protein VE01_00243 [Pseudogymnoascus verrucosus]
MVRMLLDLGVVTGLEMAMYDAVEGGDVSILGQVLVAGGLPTLVLGNAVNTGNQSMVQLLLDYGAEAGKGLKSAALSGNALKVGLLLDQGAAADVLDGRKRTRLLLEKGVATSSIREDDKMKKALVEAIINGAGNGALNGAAEVMQLLINHGFHFNFNAG